MIVISVYRPEAATPSHIEGKDYDHDITDPWDGVEIYAILESEPENLNDRLNDIAELHPGWKFHIESWNSFTHFESVHGLWFIAENDTKGR